MNRFNHINDAQLAVNRLEAMQKGKSYTLLTNFENKFYFIAEVLKADTPYQTIRPCTDSFIAENLGE